MILGNVFVLPEGVHLDDECTFTLAEAHEGFVLTSDKGEDLEGIDTKKEPKTWPVEVRKGVWRQLVFSDALEHKFPNAKWRCNVIKFRVNPQWGVAGMVQFLMWQEEHPQPRKGWRGYGKEQLQG